MENTRITAPIVKKVLDEHLQEHARKYDVKLHDVYHAVLGEHGKGGLCEKVSVQEETFKNFREDIAEIKDSMRWVVRIVLGAVILAVIKLVIIP